MFGSQQLSSFPPLLQFVLKSFKMNKYPLPPLSNEKREVEEKLCDLHSLKKKAELNEIHAIRDLRFFFYFLALSLITLFAIWKYLVFDQKIVFSVCFCSAGLVGTPLFISLVF